MALRKFRMMQDEEARSQETTHEEQGSVGVQVSTAVNLLNNFIREIDDNELYIKSSSAQNISGKRCHHLHS